MMPRIIWILRSLFICLALACFSGVSAQAEPRMSLVGPGVGWAILNQPSGLNLNIPNHHLFWTSDDGANWKDITPQDPASHEIAGVFFLDASRGWVLLALKREPGNVTDIFGFDLASTTDGGSSWTIKPLSSLAEGVGWTASAQIFFLDGARGWMSIESPVPHWGGEGVLLATTDGGNTWKAIQEVGGGGGYGAIRFTDPQNGWIAGGPGDQYLYATNDGGHHWREVAVPLPSAVSGLFENVAALYSPPIFKDNNHGFLSATYSGPGRSGEDVSILALFSTDNGGRTWHSESWIGLDQTANFPIVSVVDSTAVVPKRLANAGFSFVKLHPGGKATETKATETPGLTINTALVSLNFSDVNHGWASASGGRLLSTTDGGVTWKDITPGRKVAAFD